MWHSGSRRGSAVVRTYNQPPPGGTGPRRPWVGTRGHRMKTFAVVTLGLLACAGLSAGADDKKAEAAKLPAGTYKLVAGKKNGEAVGDEAKKGKYTIDAKTI